MKVTSPSRIGDIAEFYAVTWLWDHGFEVFTNCGCTGAVDLVALSPEGEIVLIDVKSRQTVNRQTNRSPEQKKLGVRQLSFNPTSRELRFVEHKE